MNFPEKGGPVGIGDRVGVARFGVGKVVLDKVVVGRVGPVFQKGSLTSFVERQNSTEDIDFLSASGLERRDDGLVYWRCDSRDHPRNWSHRRKCFDTFIIIFLEFYTYESTSPFLSESFA